MPQVKSHQKMTPSSNLRILFTFLVFLLLASCATEKQNQASYANPVIPGEIPDPSIIRVGETYYAIGTSFDFVPNYPLYQSTDLVNWEQIGSLFVDPPEWTSDDFWAPELFYHEGTFFVYYTTRKKEDRISCIGVASTKDISKGFTDHGILVEWGEEAIDAFVFKDEDGKLYITWKAYGLTEGRPIEILASELSPDGLSLVGEHWTLCDHSLGWKGGNDEGQCIVKHGDYYYMLYSDGGCCDNQCDYRIMVSRSKDLRTGWEQIDKPILEGGDVWRCPGHGTLVSTPDGRYFYMYHAYHIEDFEYIGRQGMLDELAWDEESGWPYMVYGNTPSVSAPLPFADKPQKRDMERMDYYSSERQLELREWDILFPKPEYQLNDDVLILKTTHEGVNFLGFRPENGNYSLEARVSPGEGMAGIGIYTHQDKMLVFTANPYGLTISKVEEGQKLILAEVGGLEAKLVYIRYTATQGRNLSFHWSLDGKKWDPIPINGKSILDGTYLATWGYSPRAGLFVKGKVPGEHQFSEMKVSYDFDRYAHAMK